MNLEQIIELDKSCYMNVFGSRTPICFEYGKGSTLFDKSGEAYIDFLGGIAVNCLGYGDEGLTQAISDQAKKLIHCSNLFYIEKQAELAETLNRLSGGFLNNHESGCSVSGKAFWNGCPVGFGIDAGL